MGQNEDQTVTTRYTLRKTLWLKFIFVLFFSLINVKILTCHAPYDKMMPIRL